MLINSISYTEDLRGPDMYYGKYTHKLTARFPCIHWVRYTMSEQVFQERLIYKPLLWVTGSGRNTQSKETIKDRITRDGGNISSLAKFVVWRAGADWKSGAKLVMSSNQLSFYYDNSIQEQADLVNNFLDTFKWDGLSHVQGSIRQRIQNYQRGTVYQKYPKHKLRVYVNSITMSEDESNEFMDMADMYGLKLCPTLKKNLTELIPLYHRKFYTFHNNFFDLDDERVLTVMAIKYPRLIKKICTIERC